MLPLLRSLGEDPIRHPQMRGIWLQCSETAKAQLCPEIETAGTSAEKLVLHHQERSPYSIIDTSKHDGNLHLCR